MKEQSNDACATKRKKMWRCSRNSTRSDDLRTAFGKTPPCLTLWSSLLAFLIFLVINKHHDHYHYMMMILKVTWKYLFMQRFSVTKQSWTPSPRKLQTFNLTIRYSKCKRNIFSLKLMLRAKCIGLSIMYFYNIWHNVDNIGGYHHHHDHDHDHKVISMIFTWSSRWLGWAGLHPHPHTASHWERPEYLFKILEYNFESFSKNCLVCLFVNGWHFYHLRHTPV